MTRTRRGICIVFEGGEGSGKTLQARLLARRLKKEGKSVLMTHEPGGTHLGKVIRQLILHGNDRGIDHRAELFLFLADRAQHVATLIQPALAKGKIVICDRFSGSTLAYQCGGRKLPNEPLIRKMDQYARETVTPDLVILFDVDPRLGLQRKKKGRERLSRIDKEELSFHRRVREYFQKVSQSDRRWVHLSTAEDSIEETAEKVWRIVQKRLFS